MYIFDLAIENHHRFFVSFIVPENGNNSQDYSTKYHHVNTLDVCHARHNNKSRKKNNLLNIELKKIIEIMKLYPQKRVSAIGLISMTESQDVYLSFFLL